MAGHVPRIGNQSDNRILGIREACPRQSRVQQARHRGLLATPQVNHDGRQPVLHQVLGFRVP
ncbi:hypothetical protein SMALB_3507 [Streptomyces malaysiensis]|uniref:Uncharacterized protein n=1 Tax=Streptomyces malaysiensis TaxID=92644 RepID=A0A7X5X2Q1_STRMQ|nr:hypothetical protein [Streptomyces malaysiensis]